jgi:hypothetical protein
MAYPQTGLLLIGNSGEFWPIAESLRQKRDGRGLHRDRPAAASIIDTKRCLTAPSASLSRARRELSDDEMMRRKSRQDRGREHHKRVRVESTAKSVAEMKCGGHCSK